jgi:hypothetical protein
MKKLLTATILSALLLTQFSIALAQDATPSAKRTGTPVTVRQRIDDRKELIASRSAELKARLALFKDKRKAALAEKISTNLNKINERITTQMLEHLTQIAKVLAKAEAKDEADPSVVEAKTAVTTATDAVEAQQQKDYTISIATESAARASVKAKRDELHTDLMSVHDLIMEARKATATAIASTSSMNEEEEEATESGQQ